MKLSDFDYRLPKELIAQHPCERRDHSRLLVLNRRSGQIEHREFCDIIDYISPGDAVVLNDTKVIPARLFGKTQNGAKVEILLLRQAGPVRNTFSNGAGELWDVLAKPSSKLKQGIKIEFDSGRLSGEVVEAQGGNKLLRFSGNGELRNIIVEIGEVPLPPYIKRKPEDSDKERYQTVYARKEGAVAAPTAGLHFTQGLIEEVSAKGARITYLTLHVGHGTFKPVNVDDVAKHKMDEEYFELPEESTKALNEIKVNGGRIFATGTTSCRVLETCARQLSALGPQLTADSGYTSLFIYPGYEFKFTDCLLTNFHLPKTTLLMLVCAFAGRDLIMRAYQEAILRRYRFYSYGDAMLIL